MDISFENTPLVKFIQSRDEPLYQDLLKLKKNTERWLSYVPTTFAHYPSHGADHSEEIVRKMSAILFKNNDVEQPAAKDFNEIEAAILVAAAYTHDAGMVVSEEAKEDLLRSAEWKEYIANNGDVEQDWKKTLDIIENDQQELNEHERLYVAGKLQRWLITEFFRRGHALRSGEFLRFNPNVFGADCLKDRQFRDAVAKVAEGHGIGYRELENDHAYPEETSIGMSPVNLRFLAIIMRFGDLLDMRSERSDTTYRSLTGIPEESVPHWDQYEDFRDEVTTTEKIGLSAYCPTQESYRVLRTWCSWIEQETREASIIMKRAKRHSDWTPPKAKVASAEGQQTFDDTIFIRPSPNATYVPHDWKFYFNRDLIIQRLASDVYGGNDLAFLRELIQNSLDATRARLSLFLEEYSSNVIENTYKAEAFERERFPITITLEDADPEDIHTQIITIEDNGIGMNEDIIKRYFLQIGQSYYTSREFRSKYSFTPTSQFGIGFLSVFGVSDKIEVSTYRYDKQSPALKITLTSPNDYLLTELCDKQKKSGTTIKVYLKSEHNPDDFIKFVQKLTEGSEIPIFVKYKNTTHRVNKYQITETKIPVSTDDDIKYELKVYDIESCNGHGQVGLWFLNDNGKLQLNYTIDHFKKCALSLGISIRDRDFYHGIDAYAQIKSFGGRDTSKSAVYWFNRTSRDENLHASRLDPSSPKPQEIKEQIEEIIEQEFNKNLLNANEKYHILHNLYNYINFSFIRKQKTIEAKTKEKNILLSVNDISDLQVIVTTPLSGKKTNPSIADGDIHVHPEELSKIGRPHEVESIEIISATLDEETYLTTIRLTNEKPKNEVESIGYESIVLLDVKNSKRLLVPVFGRTNSTADRYRVFNTQHPYGAWLKELQELEQSGKIPKPQIDLINKEVSSVYIDFGESCIEKFLALQRQSFIPKAHPLPELSSDWEGYESSNTHSKIKTS